MNKRCLECSNRVGADFCTMRKDMKLAQYNKCSGFKQLPKKAKVQYKHKKKVLTNVGLEECNFSTSFLKFVKTGGAWSFRTNERLF